MSSVHFSCIVQYSLYHNTVKPVYNDHLMGYFSAFWRSSRRQVLVARVNWHLQSLFKHITEQITGNRFYYRGGRYRQVSLYGYRYNVTLYIGQQHPITIYRTVFFPLLCVVLVLSVIKCYCYYFLYIILFHHDFHHDSCDYRWVLCGHSLLFELHFRLSVTK